MAKLTGKGGKKALIAVAASAGSLLAVAGIGLSNGYIPAAFFLGITAAEMGLLSGVAFLMAILIYLF